MSKTRRDVSSDRIANLTPVEREQIVKLLSKFIIRKREARIRQDKLQQIR